MNTPDPRERLRLAVRALYLDGNQAGLEAAADIAFPISEEAHDAIQAARAEDQATAGAQFDDDWPAGSSEPPRWEVLREILDAAHVLSRQRGP